MLFPSDWSPLPLIDMFYFFQYGNYFQGIRIELLVCFKVALYSTISGAAGSHGSQPTKPKLNKILISVLKGRYSGWASFTHMMDMVHVKCGKTLFFHFFDINVSVIFK